MTFICRPICFSFTAYEGPFSGYKVFKCFYTIIWNIRKKKNTMAYTPIFVCLFVYGQVPFGTVRGGST